MKQAVNNLGYLITILDLRSKLLLLYLVDRNCMQANAKLLATIQLCARDEPILPAKFLEKQDYESKEQNSGKIGGVSWQNQMLHLNE